MLSLIWFLLPAGFANMTPILAARCFPRWDTPIDFGRSWRGKRIFGSHKTIRGLVSGVLVATLVFAIQQLTYARVPPLRALILLDYEHLPIWTGGLLGLGALLGDLAKSFLKRRIGIAPGRAWPPWDQMDWVIGTMLLIALYLPLTPSLVMVALLFAFFSSALAHWLGYLIHWNQSPI